ncbi:phenylalanine--tRNA ligase subunit alpha [Candidatus Woesearchaeota archaeon]|nr:phenylalanine--tRNA ligase subunit alpha [Candidatus Woesearchaeota archaeon]
MTLQDTVSTFTELERKVFPALAKEHLLSGVCRATGLSQVEVMRAFQWLGNKQLVTLAPIVKEMIQLDEDGEKYAKKGLPEKALLRVTDTPSSIPDLMEKSGLGKQEFNVSLGVLKSKAAILMDKGQVSMTVAGKAFLEKETLEEKFLAKLLKRALPREGLADEEKFALDTLLKRKRIVKVQVSKDWKAELTDDGKEAQKIDFGSIATEERLTSQMLKDGSWKDKSFRAFDVSSKVPRKTYGKRHFVNQANAYAKQIWIDMGFEEMTGTFSDTSFWVFDALFTAQDHPVRELQDTFYIAAPEKGRLPEQADIVAAVKQAHESGIDGSCGWQYSWDEEDAKQNVLRTHTTVLSAHTLAKLRGVKKPGKYFALSRVFRNEALDWKHLFEFQQTEGIVIDPDANFRHLLGYLKQFFAKMGFPEARFRPAYFPYTEPSVEIDVYHPIKEEWMEIGGAGIFRPEVTVPLLGEDIPVLAWGPGFDRIIMDFYEIVDLRDMYKNDLKQLREMKAWFKA